MTSWSKPGTVLPGIAAPKSAPILVPFLGELWSFWIDGKSSAIAYTVTKENGWVDVETITNRVVDPITGQASSATEYQAQFIGNDPPLLAVAVRGSTLHLVFSATKKDTATNKIITYLRHLQYVTETNTWSLMKQDPPAERISGGLNLVSFRDQLHLVWSDPNKKRLIAIYAGAGQATPWIMETFPTIAASSGAAMAAININETLHLLTYSADPSPKLLDHVFDTTTEANIQPALFLTHEVQKGTSTSSLSACGFLDYSFWVGHNPETKAITIMEYMPRTKLKQVAGLEAVKSNFIPAIEVSKNKLYCVWVDDKGVLSYAFRNAIPFMPDMANWMTPLGGKIKISSLTIPGTHDSGAISYVPFVGCHQMTIKQQLENGIRYFDLRAGYGFSKKRTQPVVHHDFFRIFVKTPGSTTIDIPSNFDALTVSDVFDTFYQFLADHPGEGLVVQVKHDGFDPTGKAKDDDELLRMADDVWKLIRKTPQRWIIENEIPTLEALRGKIQLVRRFVNGYTADDSIQPDPETLLRRQKFGIPVLLAWYEKAQAEVIKTTFKFNFLLQDYFDLKWENDASKFPSLSDKKWSFVKDILERARTGWTAQEGQITWFLNFTSGVRISPVGLFIGQAHTIATGFWHTPWSPLVNAYGVNGRLLEYFGSTDRKPGTYGTVIMDFPEQPADLIASIVRTNYAQ